jgi:hypothetical protein
MHNNRKHINSSWTKGGSNVLTDDGYITWTEASVRPQTDEEKLCTDEQNSSVSPFFAKFVIPVIAPPKYCNNNNIPT